MSQRTKLHNFLETGGTETAKHQKSGYIKNTGNKPHIWKKTECWPMLQYYLHVFWAVLYDVEWSGTGNNHRLKLHRLSWNHNHKLFQKINYRNKLFECISETRKPQFTISFKTARLDQNSRRVDDVLETFLESFYSILIWKLISCFWIWFLDWNLISLNGSTSENLKKNACKWRRFQYHSLT